MYHVWHDGKALVKPAKVDGGTPPYHTPRQVNGGAPYYARIPAEITTFDKYAHAQAFAAEAKEHYKTGIVQIEHGSSVGVNIGGMPVLGD